MVLSQPDIRKAVEKGEIVFSPELEDRQWGEASVDLRLGFQFTKLREVHGVTVSIAEGLRSIVAKGQTAVCVDTTVNIQLQTEAVTGHVTPREGCGGLGVLAKRMRMIDGYKANMAAHGFGK